MKDYRVKILNMFDANSRIEIMHTQIAAMKNNMANQGMSINIYQDSRTRIWYAIPDPKGLPAENKKMIYKALLKNYMDYVFGTEHYKEFMTQRAYAAVRSIDEFLDYKPLVFLPSNVHKFVVEDDSERYVHSSIISLLKEKKIVYYLTYPMIMSSRDKGSYTRAKESTFKDIFITRKSLEELCLRSNEEIVDFVVETVFGR